MRNWLLPEKFEDILPPQARRIDRMRGKLLELFRVHGYELVIPPMLEYLESLLTGTGHDLDLRTFKLVDQLSGRTMGVRADIAPQVARIDAHLLNRKGVTGLCYAGSVVLTRPRGVASTREPLQICAEIYGHPGIESDLEIQQLLVDSLAACGISGARLDIGHVAVFRAICRHGGVGAELESELYEALEGKDLPALRVVTQSMPKATRKALLALPELYGDGYVLEREQCLARAAQVSRNRRGAHGPQGSFPKRQHPRFGGSGGPSRISLPQRSGVCGLCAGRGQRGRARRALRRGRQGIRPRSARDGIQHGHARSRAHFAARGGSARHSCTVLERFGARHRDPQAANRRGGGSGRASGTRRRGRSARLRPRARQARRRVDGAQTGQELKRWPRTS